MNYDYELEKMIIQDFCNRQQNLIINKVFDYINKNFVDAKNVTLGIPDIGCNKDTFDNYINRVLDSDHFSQYIRIPKPLQDYLDVKVMVDKEVSEQIQKAKYDVHMDFINSIHKVNRGLRRYSGVQEQRTNGEYS